MTEESPGKRRSDLLDSILDTIEDTAQPDKSSQMFRPEALKQLDVATEVDNQLPLVSRRSWLVVMGAAVIIAGFLAWAALTPTVDSVSTTGRMVTAPGLVPIVAPEPGVLSAFDVPPGNSLLEGQTAGALRTPTGEVPLVSSATGQVWQLLVTPGEVAAAGESIATVLPPGSDRSLLAAVPEQQSLPMRAGMEVDVASGAAGQVVSVGAPIPAAEVLQRTGIDVGQPGNYSIVAIDVSEPLPAGSLLPAKIILGKTTILNRVLEGS